MTLAIAARFVLLSSRCSRSRARPSRKASSSTPRRVSRRTSRTRTKASARSGRSRTRASTRSRSRTAASQPAPVAAAPALRRAESGQRVKGAARRRGGRRSRWRHRGRRGQGRGGRSRGGHGGRRIAQAAEPSEQADGRQSAGAGAGSAAGAGADVEHAGPARDLQQGVLRLPRGARLHREVTREVREQ